LLLDILPPAKDGHATAKVKKKKNRGMAASGACPPLMLK
jgi:hypothetical protein